MHTKALQTIDRAIAKAQRLAADSDGAMLRSYFRCYAQGMRLVMALEALSQATWRDAVDRDPTLATVREVLIHTINLDSAALDLENALDRAFPAF